MSKELHIAIQEAIGNLGPDVLKSPYFVPIIQSYGSLVEGSSDAMLNRDILDDITNNGLLNEMTIWRDLPEKEVLIKGKRVLKQYDNTREAHYVVNEILTALNKPTIPIPHKKQNALSNIQSAKVKRTILNIIKWVGIVCASLMLIGIASYLFFGVLIVGLLWATLKPKKRRYRRRWL